MKYALLVALREFGEHVHTKGFWIGLLMFPLLLTVGIVGPSWLEKNVKRTRNFVVVDPAGRFTELVDKAVAADHKRREERELALWMKKKEADPNTPEFEGIRTEFRRVEVPEAAANDAPATLANLRPWLKGDKKVLVDGKEEDLFALVYLPERAEQLRRGVEYWCKNLADTDLSNLLERSFRDWLREREYAEKGVSAEDSQRIAKIEVEFDRKDPSKAEGEEDVSDLEQMRQWAPVVGVYMLFVAILTVAQMLLASTIEEKSNRIIEVLLSSVTPAELMFGKLIGVALVGITMLIAWLGSAYLVGAHFSGIGIEGANNLLALLVDFKLIGPFVIYFLAAYVLFASIILALGSACSSLKDAQNFMGPVTLLLMVPLICMVFIARDPNSVLATVLSWIPIFTPFVMMNRIAGDPPLFEVIGTSVLLFATIVGTIWLAGRIFQNGILRTGEAPKVLELFRMMRKS